MAKRYSKLFLFSVASFFLVLFSFQSCMKEKFDWDKISTDNWEPTFALALVNASLGVEDILAAADSSIITVNDENILTLVYKGETFTINAENIIPLPQQPSITQTIADGNTAASLPTDGTITQTVNYNFSYAIPGGLELDSIWAKTGSITFILNSSFQHNGTINVSIPSFRKNNVPFSVDLPFTYSGSVVSVFHNESLTGYTVDLTGGSTPMEIPVILTGTLNYQSPNPVNPGDIISLQMTMNSMEFSGVFGYITAPILAFNDSIEIDVFKNSNTYPGIGVFELQNPKIKITIDNSLGVPIEGEMTTLQSVNKNEQVTSILPLNGGGFTNNKFSIGYPIVLGENSTSVFTLDKTTANVASLISSTQKSVKYGLNIGINPNGIQIPRNFVTDQSQLVINTEMELPLEGYAYGFDMVDTSEFSFTDDGPEILSLLVRTNITNGFPLNVRMQLIFMNENYVKLDSLFVSNQNGIVDNSIILSGKVNGDGRVSQATNKITDILISGDRVRYIKNAKYILIKGSAETYNAGPGSANPTIKIYDDYKLDVKLGVKVQGRVDL